MLYIFAIIVGVCIFISIFYINTITLIVFLFLFFLSNIIIQKSLAKALKRFFYILPYFLGVLILQAITPRGEFYNFLGFKLDKTGVDFTVLYFVRLISILYFLSFFFFVIRKIAIPKNKIFEELFRVSIFMSIVKKSFYIELKKIKDSNAKFFEKLNMLSDLIDNVYKASFKNYPYDNYLRVLKK